MHHGHWLILESIHVLFPMSALCTIVKGLRNVVLLSTQYFLFKKPQKNGGM